MKPKNKHQKLILQLNKKLKMPGQKIKDWAFKHCFPTYAIRFKNGKVNCLTCGNKSQLDLQQWQTEIIDYNCPNCKNRLKIINTNNRTISGTSHFEVYTTVQNYQVIRTFKIYLELKTFKEPKYRIEELSRNFIRNDGHIEYVSKYKMSYYSDIYCGFLELRKHRIVNEKIVAIYAPNKVIPEIIRNGYSGNIADYDSTFFFSMILSNSYAETLAKNGYYDLIYFIPKVENYWSTIKTVMKNNYQIVGDPINYFDYLHLLSDFGKDLKSSKYVCPVDLHKEHQKYVSKKRKIELQKKKEKLKEEIKTKQKDYVKHILKFKNLSFVTGPYQVKILKSVFDFLKYGELFNHCLFVREYYKKNNSLVFVVFYKNVPVETIEYSLPKMTVSQSRGNNNQETIHNSEIINYMNSSFVKREIMNCVKRTTKKQLKVA